MIRPFSLEFKLDFDVKRCSDCGRYYAVECPLVLWSTCPYCHNRCVADLNARKQELSDQVASLKGQITKLKKRMGRGN